MRFLVVSLLVLLLFQPLLETLETRVEKPVVVLALDNSQSMVSTKDSNDVRINFLNNWKALTEKLGADYEVVPLLFGDNVSDGNDAAFSDQITHFGKLQRAIDARFSGRNLAALVIASDGLYNKGPHPVSTLKQLNIPVFTIGLGDTTLHRDLLISNVSANKIAYLGNEFPIRLNIEGRKALGKIPNKLGGYDLRKTFIFEGINVEEALKKAALDLGMGFTPLPSAATRAISNKAFKYKDTRDDFDGISSNKDFH